jgi:hypothetical protein
MAKRRMNPVAGDIEGLVGDLVFYRRKGEPCVRRRPVREKPFTRAEKKNQSRFGSAGRYAKAVLTDPIQEARYEKAAKGTKGSAQNLAVSDFMRFPKLTEIDLSGYTGRVGEIIRVRAEEGVLGAAGVKVVIADRAKATVEQGDAVVEADGLWWAYAAQKELAPDQAVWITVTANDQPGNRTTKTVRHSTGG